MVSPETDTFYDANCRLWLCRMCFNLDCVCYPCWYFLRFGPEFTYNPSSIPIQLYLVDTFKYAASALAAVAVLRSLFGFFFPLFAGQMFDALTIGGGYS